MQKIIFLDIDGVLCNRESCSNWHKENEHLHRPYDAHPNCIEQLNRIISETGAEIVVSSTWRLFGRESVIETLIAWGVIGNVIGITPNRHIPRGLEIQEWLDRSNNNNAKFVILDDDSDMKELMPYLVKTSFEPGLTIADANKAIEMLNKD